MSTEYPQPLWKLTLEGKDITANLAPRLMQLALTDDRGLEADQLDITLSDADQRLDIPARGVKIHLALGWSDSGLIDKGYYTVDEVEHSGTPDQLTIRARSADLREGITQTKERSWHATTVGAVVRKIADEHELEPVISDELAGAEIAHQDQQSESDANFLSRLAEMFDAICTVKADQLLFFKVARGKSASGQTFAEVVLTRASGDRHRFSVADREGCQCVCASYYDVKAGRKKTVTIKAEKEAGKDKVAASGDATRTLRHVYSCRASAARAAKSALDRSQRGVATFSLTLALGRPDIVPELPVRVSGWKPAIDGAGWRVAKVTHHLTTSGLTTDLELEMRAEPSEREEPETPDPAEAPDGSD
ncbi:MAG: phage late control D family protein [Azoarcus sp.]|jgi:phage protein D|nr:phage late control D family protein [Azoarcus sp.]